MRTTKIQQPTASITRTARSDDRVGSKSLMGYYGGAFAFPYITESINAGVATLVPVIEKSERVAGSELATDCGVSYLYQTRYYRADNGAEIAAA